jgi:hypothetical protein
MSAGGWNLYTLTRFTPSTVLFRALSTEIGFLVGGRRKELLRVILKIDKHVEANFHELNFDAVLFFSVH